MLTILDVIGPQKEDKTFSSEASQYMNKVNSLTKKEPYFDKLFSKVKPDFVDLIRNLLKFNPSDRADVD